MLLSPETEEAPAAERAKFDLGDCGDENDDENDDDDEGIGDKTIDDEAKTEKTDVPTTNSDLIQLSSRRYGDEDDEDGPHDAYDNRASNGRTDERTEFYGNRSTDTLAEEDDEGDTDANSAVTGNSSHPTTSGMTSSTDRFPIDFSNRAKLPRGVVNVRPHLEKVDNVPLLVSLFTDCTPETSTEMMDIMRGGEWQYIH